jgi:hypothetical protein
MCSSAAHTYQPAGLPNNDVAVTEAHQHDLRYCTLQLQIECLGQHAYSGAEEEPEKGSQRMQAHCTCSPPMRCTRSCPDLLPAEPGHRQAKDAAPSCGISDHRAAQACAPEICTRQSMPPAQEHNAVTVPVCWVEDGQTRTASCIRLTSHRQDAPLLSSSQTPRPKRCGHLPKTGAATRRMATAPAALPVGCRTTA